MANKLLKGLRPVHPGELLRETVLPALNMSVAEAAAEMRISRQTLHRITAEKASITPAMALRLGKFCGNGPNLWLRMQEAYDLWHAEQELQDVIADIRTVKAA